MAVSTILSYFSVMLGLVTSVLSTITFFDQMIIIVEHYTEINSYYQNQNDALAIFKYD